MKKYLGSANIILALIAAAFLLHMLVSCSEEEPPEKTPTEEQGDVLILDGSGESEDEHIFTYGSHYAVA